MWTMNPAPWPSIGWESNPTVASPPTRRGSLQPLLIVNLRASGMLQGLESTPAATRHCIFNRCCWILHYAE